LDTPKNKGKGAFLFFFSFFGSWKMLAYC